MVTAPTYIAREGNFPRSDSAKVDILFLVPVIITVNYLVAGIYARRIQ